MLKTVEYHSWTFPRLNEGSPKKSTESHEARHDRSQSKLLLYEDSRISGKGRNRDDGEDGEDGKYFEIAKTSALLVRRGLV